MKKIIITFETKSRYKKVRHASKSEKLISAFMRLASSLRPRDKAELSRLIVIAFALVAQTYLLIWVLHSFSIVPDFP